MQTTESSIIRQPKNDEQQHLNVRLIDVLEILNIKVDDFVNALGGFIGSKSFEKLVAKGLRKKVAGNEESPYPKLYLHVLTNFIVNSELSEIGYNTIIDQFISGYNDDHNVDTAAIHC